jgi:quinol monooxygenase YgiN
MYAVVGKWQMDPAQREQQDQVLNEQIVPMVKQAPGFVSAYWARAVNAPESVSFVLFDNHADAERFAAVVRTDPEGREQYGVESSGWLSIVEIEATA